MKAYSFQIVFLLLFSFVTLAENDRPNILVILADDLGYNDLSIMGCKQFKTPAIDSIAQNGINFSQAYVSNSVCAPSRAGFLSGRIGIGFEANYPKGDFGLNPKIKAMSKMLKEAGYKTYCIGKWHLGETEKYHPNNRGFDEFYGLLSGSRSYFAEKRPARNKVIERNGTPTPEPKGSYMTDRFTDAAVDYLKKHESDKPFFMYLSYTAPHGPLTSKPEYLSKYKHIKDKKRRNYAGMMQSLDEGVAKVLKVIESRPKLKNTLIVFFSDNGGPIKGKNRSDNGLLKGGKGSNYEGGNRVPFFVQWKGKVKSGQKINEMISSLDLLPTFASLAKAKLPPELSGINLTPLLSGKIKKLDKRGFVWRRGGKTQCAYRLGKYKWISSRRNGNEALYDIEADPSEKKNLIKKYPEIAQRLKKEFKKWEAQAQPLAFKQAPKGH